MKQVKVCVDCRKFFTTDMLHEGFRCDDCENNWKRRGLL